MANIKQAKKRVGTNAIRQAHNKDIKSKIKTLIKNVETLANEKKKDEAVEALKLAQKEIEIARSKGIFHANNASRKISRITKIVNNI